MSDPRAALEAIGVLPDTEIDIGDAALQLARVDAPDADWQAARAHLSDLARDAVELADTIGTNDLSMRAEALAGLIAGRYAYAGDAETYDDLANANLISVIRAPQGACRSRSASSGCIPRAPPDGARMAWISRRISWWRWKARASRR